MFGHPPFFFSEKKKFFLFFLKKRNFKKIPFFFRKKEKIQKKRNFFSEKKKFGSLTNRPREIKNAADQMRASSAKVRRADSTQADLFPTTLPEAGTPVCRFCSHGD